MARAPCAACTPPCPSYPASIWPQAFAHGSIMATLNAGWLDRARGHFTPCLSIRGTGEATRGGKKSSSL